MLHVIPNTWISVHIDLSSLVSHHCMDHWILGIDAIAIYCLGVSYMAMVEEELQEGGIDMVGLTRELLFKIRKLILYYSDRDGIQFALDREQCPACGPTVDSPAAEAYYLSRRVLGILDRLLSHSQENRRNVNQLVFDFNEKRT